MIFHSFVLSGSCLKELNTEIRYNVAAARVDGGELIRFSVSPSNDEQKDKRLVSCISRVLGSLKREGNVQFFVKSLSDTTAEAEYINNKFSAFVQNSDGADAIYVKL